MGKKNTFYGVAGLNAYGVYNNYGKVIEDKKYYRKFNTKKFNEFEDAKKWAEERFWDLQDNLCPAWEIDEIERVNWAYYKQTGYRAEAMLISKAEKEMELEPELEPVFWINSD